MLQLVVSPVQQIVELEITPAYKEVAAVITITNINTKPKNLVIIGFIPIQGVTKCKSFLINCQLPHLLELFWYACYQEVLMYQRLYIQQRFEPLQPNN
jgi:hypothetical protein